MFCEGIASKPDYINGLKRIPEVKGNTAINVEIDPDSGVPLTLVKLAIARSADKEVDECWCVFDVEWPQQHPNLRQAISLAQEHGIRLAISDSCFELWLALHFTECTSHQNTDDAERHSRKLEGRSGKRIDAAKYMPLRKTAAERAAALARRHARDQSECPHDNPSSGMFELLAAIEPQGQASTRNR